MMPIIKGKLNEARQKQENSKQENKHSKIKLFV
jgi:hypothetical protein